MSEPTKPRPRTRLELEPAMDVAWIMPKPDHVASSVRVRRGSRLHKWCSNGLRGLVASLSCRCQASQTVKTCHQAPTELSQRGARMRLQGGASGKCHPDSQLELPTQPRPGRSKKPHLCRGLAQE